ncbi:hypothetical protein PDE_07789 [Penicillium oxalicum 114-2]|uniref:Cysteine-rich transmembrane CYSTM domain-containing protein n=1 Tax=Penicillium oxalicum (strain 114-2 / CGMCC 5302) TaxID=933388 RepID=S7ZR28_PENO1|nr:hypothetical protein PDE_07789 [Penicillium oxalicum 114-2]
MFGSGFFNWFSNSSAQQEPTTNAAAWDLSMASVQTQQPTSPEAPSTDRVATEQSSSQENAMKLRGGGAGDVCCGVCTGLLCFECCECCCCC